MRIALCHNAWHVCGGGELYLGTLAQVLAADSDVDLLLTTAFPKHRLRSLLNLAFDKVGCVQVANPLASQNLRTNRRARLSAELALQSRARNYDVVIRVATGTVPPPPCGRVSLLHVQVPFAPSAVSLKGKMQAAWNSAARAGYARVFFNSHFTQGFFPDVVKTGRATVLEPPVDVSTHAPLLPWAERSPTILAVGRFDHQGHCKNQLELVQAFASLVTQGLSGWTLMLAGTVSQSRSSQTYFDEVRSAARGLPVAFAPNLSREALLAHYERSRIFWHATGFGHDEQRAPDKVEHFGISTVEAMARGCLPVVNGKGGQKEIVQDGISGYLWQTLPELVAATASAIAQGQAMSRLLEAARTRAQTFSLERFANKARELIPKKLIQKS